MTRGFVTLATGNIAYYKMAVNMLESFKLHNPDARFAIICDKRNEYTDMFDDVVVLDNANGDYRDKFLLLIKSPYDESIFIEPDCLIYKNLDCFWNMLSAESDFTSFGWNHGGIVGWFRTEETRTRLEEIIPELKDDSVTPIFNPGYLFIRKGQKCQKMYEDCLYVAQKIANDPLLSTYPPLICRGKLRDDPIIYIAMAINDFVCHTKPEEAKCIFLPSKYTINEIDIVEGRLNVTDKNGRKFKDCALIHFSTRRAFEEGLYLWQTIILKQKRKNSCLYKILNNKICYVFCVIYRGLKTKIKHFVELLKNR